MGFLMALPDAGAITIIVGALGGIASTLILQIMSYLREGRAHRWLQEQSALDRRERLATAEELKRQHEEAAMTITLNTQHAAAVLSQKIDDNTEISVKAFDAANNVNEKLVAIGEARLRGTSAERKP